MQENYYKKNLEVIQDLEIDEKEIPSFRKKKQLLNFFWNRDYREIRRIEELNEFDLVESLYFCHIRYKRIGQILGLVLFSTTWNTMLYRLTPISKLLLGGIVIHYSGEIALYYNIDKIFNPLQQVFDKHYRPLLVE